VKIAETDKFVRGDQMLKTLVSTVRSLCRGWKEREDGYKASRLPDLSDRK